MSRSTKDFLAILLIITMVISFIGTLAAISSLTMYRDVPISQESTTESVGKVSVYVTPPPVDVTGKVLVEVLPEEGG